MADPSAREQKLIQYLNEAYGKEKQLETTLQAQIELAKEAARKPLQKRFQDHLKETKAQARGLERRIKQLNGRAEVVSLPGPDAASGAASAVASAANKALAAAKGPVQALRGTSPADNLLRNVRDAVWNEAEEIAHYDAIEALADALNDRDTAKLAKEFRRQEERMQSFLRKQIAQLVKQVVRDEIPARERRANGGARRKSTGAKRTSARRTKRTAAAGAKTTAAAGARKTASGRTKRTASAGARKTASGRTKRTASSAAKRTSTGGAKRTAAGGAKKKR